jgi:hypothetical protein
VSYVAELRAELAACGIRGRLARRIVLEFEDHLACHPEAALGEPPLIAARFAAELGVVRTRRATLASFGALALAAIGLVAAARAFSAAAGRPDLFGARGLVVALGGLGIALGCQVSFVAGVLGVWPIARAKPALRLVQRRMMLAVAAGGLAVVGEAVDAIAMRPLLPGWWFALAATAAVVPALALAVSARALRSAATLTPAAAESPSECRPLPSALLVGVAVAAVVAMCVGSAYAEHSWSEGLSRGVLEAAAIGGCFVAFGRFLGLRS